MRKLSRRFVILSVILVSGLMLLPGLHAQEDPVAAVESSSELEAGATDLKSAIADKESELGRLRDRSTRQRETTNKRSGNVDTRSSTST